METSVVDLEDLLSMLVSAAEGGHEVDPLVITALRDAIKSGDVANEVLSEMLSRESVIAAANNFRPYGTSDYWENRYKEGGEDEEWVSSVAVVSMRTILLMLYCVQVVDFGGIREHLLPMMKVFSTPCVPFYLFFNEYSDLLSTYVNLID